MPALAGHDPVIEAAGRVSSLSLLATAVEGARLSGGGATAVTGITHDSRRVEPGFLFVAVRGAKRDGLSFVPEARARGAGAVAAEGDPPSAAGIPWLTVPDARTALALLSRAFHGAPDLDLKVAGITGTNGKTTTAVLLGAAFQASGLPCGVIGTLGWRDGGDWTRTQHTTPEAPEIFSLLADLRAKGRMAAVLEVSSHALELKRVLGLQFSLAIFTNLTRDHLDFHGNMENYFAAKARLFAGLPPDAAMAVNLDDPFATRLLSPSRTRVVTYGRATRADVLPIDEILTSAGIRLKIRTPSGELSLESPLVGLPNVYNILAAMAGACALDLDPRRAADGIASVAGIPGRAERLEEGQDFTVLVDYAHSDDALSNVLRMARHLTAGRVIVVFGCGGDRDRTKRPLMGAAAVRLADLVVLTSDNPRSEDPLSIISEVAAGFSNVPGGAARQIEPDRSAAISIAVDEAQAGDLVVIAGKGHETEQILAGRRIPFDDREVVRRALRRRLGKER